MIIEKTAVEIFTYLVYVPLYLLSLIPIERGVPLSLALLKFACLHPCARSATASSRMETEVNAGTCHLLELMAFKSTTSRTHQQVGTASIV